jgi:hypothetical protein
MQIGALTDVGMEQPPTDRGPGKAALTSLENTKTASNAAASESTQT